MRWTSASVWLLCVCAALLTPSTARADAYTWTDADGTVHFSETPPPAAKSKKVSSAAVLRTSAGSTAVVPLPRSEKIWTADTPSRSLTLEKIVPLLLDAGRGFRIGSVCHAGRYSVADAAQWTQNPDLKAYFVLTLMAYGFETPSETAAKAFANEPIKPADLNVIAEVTGLDVDCGGVGKLEIKWRFWDNLRRKQVFETVTSGSDTSEPEATRGTLRSAQNIDMTRSVGGAFIRSLEVLLHKPEFLKLATPSAEPVEPSEVAGVGEDLEPLVLSFRYGLGTGSFRAQVTALKEAAPTVRTTSGHGSGVLLAPGYVLTNNHVVASEHEVIVVMGKREISARILRRDEKRDVALLKLHEDVAIRPYLVGRHPPIDGDTLYVIGTPLDEGLSQSVTKGVLSGTRELNGQSYYQTDAAVNPGNSGGPVLDDHGELVGLVVSGLRTQTGSSLNVNYIIPIQSALETLAIRPTLATKVPARAEH